MANKHPLYPIAHQVIKKAWGFYPDRKIKSVHLANGFFRFLNGNAPSEVGLLKKVVASRRGLTRTSSADVLRLPDFRRVVENTATPAVAEDATERLRQSLDEVLNQDGAFYAAVRNSTLTLTHRQHLTDDTYDQGAGSLLAQVLLAIPGQAAVAAIRRALESPDNTIYRLTQPLLQPAVGGHLNLATDKPTNEVLARLTKSCVLPGWQASFTTLAAHYDASAGNGQPLEKTAFLQRVVSLAGIGLLLHLYNSGPGDGCQPLLLCADHPLASIREVSRSTLARAKRRLRAAFRDALREELQESNEDSLSLVHYQSWATGRLRDKEQEQYLAELKQETAMGTSDFEAAVRALTGPGLRAAGSESAESCASSLGKLLGLQWPRQQGPGQPYLLPVAAVYDALVCGLLLPGQVVTFEAFWQLAYERFGLLCGALLPEDEQRLARVGIVNVALADLQTNARAVLDELRRLGYARTYADEVSLISTKW